MSNDLDAYRQRREAFLAKITLGLSGDKRFLAAWLTGSFGRNDADEISDLDLQVVVAEPYSKLLCARQEMVSYKTSEERLALFSTFGKPALIHENNHNAPENGTFTFVLYSGSAFMVDWVLIPQEKAERSHQSILLFDKANIPVSPPPLPEELQASKKTVAEIWAFFWMMTAITIKYAIRGDLVFVQSLLEQLHGLIRETERRIERLSWEQMYTRGSISKLKPTRAMQMAALRQLIKKMQELQPKIREFTEVELVDPSAEIELLLSLEDKKHARH